MPAKSLPPLLPGDLIVERSRIEPDRLIIEARAKARVAACPRCERPSHRVHSRYHRRLRDSRLRAGLKDPDGPGL